MTTPLDRIRRIKLWRAAYKLVLFCALATLCVTTVQLALNRRAAQAAPPYLEQLDQADPLPARLPAFDPSQVTPEDLLAPAESDITLSS